MLQEKLMAEIERLNYAKDNYKKTQDLLINLEKEMFMIQGRISMLQELQNYVAQQEKNAVQVEENTESQENNEAQD